MALEAGPHIAALHGVAFPCYSAHRGRCPEPEGTEGRHTYCRRAANNILWLEPARRPLPGWQEVPSRPRWNLIDGQWRAHDASWQRVEEHRYWGVRHHVRWWTAPGGWAVGQAHREHWEGLLPRRHRVTSLDAAREAVAASWKGERTYARVPSTGTDWDGRVLVLL